MCILEFILYSCWKINVDFIYNFLKISIFWQKANAFCIRSHIFAPFLCNFVLSSFKYFKLSFRNATATILPSFDKNSNVNIKKYLFFYWNFLAVKASTIRCPNVDPGPPVTDLVVKPSCPEYVTLFNDSFAVLFQRQIN